MKKKASFFNFWFILRFFLFVLVVESVYSLVVNSVVLGEGPADTALLQIALLNVTDWANF